MIKLWEKSSIAKIALKRGVQLTTSERMAKDIKVMELGQLLLLGRSTLHIDGSCILLPNY